MSSPPSESPPASGPVTTARPKTKLVWIEVARGIAATLVILHHVSRHLAQELGYVPFRSALDPGSAAVDFFFVLSGFLILHVTKRDIGNPRRINTYLRKRVLRIYPIYWVAMLVYTAMHLASSNSAVSLTPSAILHEASLWPRTAGDPLIVGVGWSLSYEMFFYILFASFLVHRNFGRVLFTVWTVAAVLRLVGVIPPQTNSGLAILLSEYSLLFPIGMAVAVHVRKATHPSSSLVLAAALPLLAIAWYLEAAGHINGHGAGPRIGYGVLSALALYGLILRDFEGKSVTWKPLLILGECSYSVYLFHFVGIGISAKAISVLGLYGRAPDSVLAVVMIGSGLAAGLAAGLIVERPLVRWARRVA